MLESLVDADGAVASRRSSFRLRIDEQTEIPAKGPSNDPDVPYCAGKSVSDTGEPCGSLRL